MQVQQISWYCPFKSSIWYFDIVQAQLKEPSEQIFQCFSQMALEKQFEASTRLRNRSHVALEKQLLIQKGWGKSDKI